jgi:hypothetical protein
MHRLRSALLLGGVVLLASYISAPAAPTPAPLPVPVTEIDAIDANAPIAADAVQEAARLRARLATVQEKPAPQRDPFSFGAAPKSPRRAAAAPEPPPVFAPIEAPPIEWPKLVALLTDKGVVTAVLGVGEAVELLKAGESVSGFVIREISATSVEVVHVATSTATRLTLR